MSTSRPRATRHSELHFYLARLQIAFYDTIEKASMGATSDHRRSLGRADISVRFGGGRKIITMGDGTSIETSAGASTDQVAEALAKVDAAAAAPAPVAPAPRPTSPPIRKNITGASLLGGKFRDLINNAKAEIASAQADIETGVENIVQAARDGKEIARSLHAEAEDLRASFSGSSNGAPE